MMWIDAFLRYVRYEKNYSSHTVLSYKRDLLQFEEYLSHLEDAVAPERAERDHVRGWAASLIETGNTARTVARKFSALRTFYHYLQKQGVVAESPMRDIVLPKIHKSLPSFVRPAEMDALLDEKVADDDFAALRDKLILSILYMTGIRRAELIGLLERDVDTLAMQFKVTGKRNKQRIIPFGEELKTLIETYRHARRAAVGMEAPQFFVKDDGAPLYQQYVYRLVTRRLGEVTTLTHRSPHVLRHSFASAMLNDGAGLNSVKELLGHQSLASTQVYTHITFEELKRDYKQAHPRAIKKEVIMEVRIQSIHFDASEQLENFIQKKVEKLNRYCDDILAAEVTLKVLKPETSQNKEAGIKLLVPRAEDIFSSKVADTFEEAVDLSLDALVRQLQKNKEKTRSK